MFTIITGGVTLRHKRSKSEYKKKTVALQKKYLHSTCQICEFGNNKKKNTTHLHHKKMIHRKRAFEMSNKKCATKKNNIINHLNMQMIGYGHFNYNVK